MFTLGADHADGLKDAGGIVDTLKGREAHVLLTRIPGLVGDSMPGQSPGHITLVKGTLVADKNKLYH